MPTNFHNISDGHLTDQIGEIDAKIKPATLYIPIITHKSGDCIYERDVAICTFDAVVDDIYHGQIEDVARVICVDLDAGTSTDATQEVAEAVGQRTIHELRESWSNLAKWLNRHRVDFYSAADEEIERSDYEEHALSTRQLGVGRHG